MFNYDLYVNYLYKVLTLWRKDSFNTLLPQNVIYLLHQHCCIYLCNLKNQKDLFLLQLLDWRCSLNAFFFLTNTVYLLRWTVNSSIWNKLYCLHKSLSSHCFWLGLRTLQKSISDTMFHDTSCIVLIPNVYKWSHFNPINNLFLKNCAVNPFAGQRAMWKVQNFLSNVILRVLLT